MSIVIHFLKNSFRGMNGILSPDYPHERGYLDEFYIMDLDNDNYIGSSRDKKNLSQDFRNISGDIRKAYSALINKQNHK